MSLYIGIRLDSSESLVKLEKAFNEIGIAMPQEKTDDSKEYVTAMGAKEKYLSELSNYSDEEISDEYYGRNL